MRCCSSATRGSPCTARNSSNMLVTLGTFSTRQPLFATFYFLPKETLFLLDFAQKVRQAASVNEPIFVDVENHCPVVNATM